MWDAFSSEEHEREPVRTFLNNKPGFFVDVGADHPIEGSQSSHLEQRGWCGILVKPPVRLRELRSTKVFAAACSSLKKCWPAATLNERVPLRSSTAHRGGGFEERRP